MVVAGVLLRVAFMATTPVEPISDFKRYYDVAAEFAGSGALAYQGIPFISQGPAYPLILGIVFKLFGPGLVHAQVFNLLLSTATLVLFARYVAGRQWPMFVQLTSVGLLALHPGMVTYPSVLGAETLSTFLVVAAINLASRRGRGPAMALGFVLALLALARPQFLPVAFAFAALRAFASQEAAREAAWSLAMVIFTIAPWMLRNHALFDHWVPVSSNAGYTLMINNNGNNSTGAWIPLSSVSLPDADRKAFASLGSSWLLEEGDEDRKILNWTPAEDAIALGAGLRWIHAHPGRFMELSLLRLRTTFVHAGPTMLHWPFYRGGVQPWLAVTTTCMTAAIYSLALLGLLVGVMNYRRIGEQFVLAGLILIFGLSAIVIIEGQGRYTLPILPAGLVLASIALTWCHERLLGIKRFQRRP